MRVLIAISCLLAVACAGYAPYGYNVPTIDHNGVPQDEPAVAAAKAQHFAAHAQVAARGGGYAGYGGQVAAPIAAPVHYGGHYNGPLHYPVIGPHGVPQDEPAVAHARAAHYAALSEASARAGGHHYRKRRGIYGYGGHYAGPQHIPVIGPNGVPLDEPAVVAARAEHFAAHAKAGGLAGGLVGLHAVGPIAYAGHYGYAGPLHIPVIGPHGVPLDEPAVVAARAHHAAAHAEAAARSGGHIGLGLGLGYAVGPVAYGGHYGVPVIGPNGVPLDEPAVAAAKAHHAAAYAEAAARNRAYGHY